MTWQYHALRLRPTRQWLHRDLPLADVTITPALSGPQDMTASIDPETASLKMPDGRPLLEDNNVLIIAESDGIIRGGGILTGSTFTGPTWQLTISGFSSHITGQVLPTTLTYGGNNAAGLDPAGPRAGVGADPLQIVRDLWAQAQAKDRGDLGVVLGGDATSKHKKANWRNCPNAWDFTPDASTTITFEAPTSAQADNNGNYPAATIMANIGIDGTGFTKKAKSGVTPSKLVKKPIYWDYTVANYETSDLGQAFQDLAASTPFDWIERMAWSDADKTDVILRIDTIYPRLGRKRTDLRFVEGENVGPDPIPAIGGGDTYANTVIAFGAGEGKDQLRAEVSIDDGRLRVEKVVTDTSITDATKLKAAATATLNGLIGARDIQSFTVWDHKNARLGSFDVGDDIYVQIATGWAAGTQMWVRVTGYEFQPDSDAIQVSCKRSDSFSYGAITT